MKTRHLPLVTVAALLAAPGAATAQQFTPKDINYLANLWVTNETYFKQWVSGVVRFSGIGIIDSTKAWNNQPDLEVDMGASGQVACQGTAIAGLRSGDRIAISGSVYWAQTAAQMAEINDIAGSPSVTPLKEKDVLYLVPATCVAEKVK
jgi:hypothetical protein